MKFKNYSRVRLVTNRYQEEGVSSGAIGYIIEIYNDDAYEVEFSALDGITIAQIVVHEDEITLAESEEHNDGSNIFMIGPCRSLC